ncbi:hypothetical protein [Gelidibacter salicanalis]|nr:hypothetical protein [Gelidibacter salicanalis]
MILIQGIINSEQHLTDKLHIITNPSGGEDDYYNTFKNWAN